MCVGLGMRKSTLLLSMLLLAPGAPAASIQNLSGLFGLSSTPTSTATAIPHSGEAPSPPGGHYSDTTIIGFTVLPAQGHPRHLWPDGAHGTYVDGTARKLGQETGGKRNVVDRVVELWKDEAFVEAAQYLVDGSGFPLVEVVMLPAATTAVAAAPSGQPAVPNFGDLDRPSESGPSGPQAHEIYLEDETYPEEVPIQWAKALGLKDEAKVFRFQVLWSLAQARPRLFCPQVKLEQTYLPLLPGEVSHPTRVLAEGWLNYLAARTLGKAISPPKGKIPLESPRGVTQVLLAVDRAHGPDVLEAVWERVGQQDCPTLSSFVGELMNEEPKTFETLGNIFSKSAPVVGAPR